MNHNKLTLIIFFIAYPIYLDISIEEDVNLIAAIVTNKCNDCIVFFSNTIYTVVYYSFVSIVCLHEKWNYLYFDWLLVVLFL